MADSLFFSSPRFYDRLEQIITSIFFIGFVLRLGANNLSDFNVISALLLVSESMVIIVLLLRKPTEQISLNKKDWFIAVFGTCVPLLIAQGGEPFSVELAVYLLSAGFLIQVGAKISLWRSFGMVAANRGVRTNGLYRYVRHPMYMGYMLSHIGFFIGSPSIYNLAIYLLSWTFLILRIFAEERVLKEDRSYQEYCTKVPYRLLPGMF